MVGRLVSPILVGRRREVVAAEELLDAAIAGAPVHLLVAGEAGVGKTRFAGALADRASTRGALVLAGACIDLGDGGLPYGALAEALRGLAQRLGGDELREIVGPSAPDIARIVPALGPAPAAGPVQREWLQARLLEALLGVLQRLAAHAPVLLVLEDLHWADPATRNAVAFLVRNLRRERVLLALTFRSDELHRRHPLVPWLAETERSGRVARIDLPRLELDETRQLVAAILGTAPAPELVGQVQLRTDGNPFFVEELLVAADGPGVARRLPPTLREILLARVTAVPEEARGVLAAVAVAGRRADHDLVATVTGLSDGALRDALRAAVDGHLLVLDAEAEGREGYAFRHALLQEAVYDDLLPGERRRLHRAWAEALAVPHGSDAGRGRPDVPAVTPWAELAVHWGRAHDDGRAFHASLRAAEVAEQAFAFESALRQYERVLELWPGLPDPVAATGCDRADVLLRAGRAAYLAGNPHRHVALVREAAAQIDPSSEPIRAAIVGEQLGRALWDAGDTSSARAAYDAARALIPADPPTAERARVLAGWGQMLMLLDRWREAAVVCEEAIAVARLVEARQAEGHALNTLGLSLAALGRCAEGVAALEEARAIAREVMNVDDIGRAYVNLSDALFFCGDAAAAAGVVDEGVGVAEAFGIVSSYGSIIRANGILANFELGRWEVARRQAEESLQIVQESRDVDRYVMARWAPLLVAAGDLDEAGAALDRLGALLEGAPVEVQFHGLYQEARAELALWRGRPTGALAAVAEGLGQLAHEGTTWYRMRLHRLGARATADLAETARARRDRQGERVAEARGRELRAARSDLVDRAAEIQAAAQAAETRGEAATAAAEDRRLAGEPDPAAWHRAREGWLALGRPYQAAYAAYRLGEALLARGERTAAATVLGEAVAEATSLGARSLGGAVAALARRARITLPEPPPGGPVPDSRPAAAPASASDPYGLTAREREVLALVADGQTNRQIAGTLFISENTAGVHVSNILGKLGVASRTEAAAIAVRLSLGAPRQGT